MARSTLFLLSSFFYFAHAAFGGLQMETMECHSQTAARRANVEQKYGSLLSTDDNVFRSWFWSYLGQIPDTYIDWIANEQKIQVDFVGNGMMIAMVDINGQRKPQKVPYVKYEDSIRGITTAAGINGFYAIKNMWLMYPIAPIVDRPELYFGLIHEFGHAIDHYLVNMDITKKTDYDFELEALFKEAILQKQEFANIRNTITIPIDIHNKPKIGQAEYIAEVFESYYCSKDTRALMAKRYPKALAFAKKFFEAPLDLGEDEN